MNSATRNVLLDKLLKSTQYNELNNNKARVEFILNNLMSYNGIKMAVKDNIEGAKQKHKKNLSIAKNFKLEANSYLRQVSLGDVQDRNTNLTKALKSYTKSLLYIPTLEDWKTTAELYARKCQVHLQLEENKAALYSIEMALDVIQTYGQQQQNKINNDDDDNMFIAMIFPYNILKINCLKKLLRYQEAIDLMEQMLQQKMIPNVPKVSINDFMEMKENVQYLLNNVNENTMNVNESDSETKKPNIYFNYRLDGRCNIKQSPVVGRHFIANDVIPEQTIILEEKPYSIIMENDYLHKKCSNCYQDLNYKFFPCLHCTELIFCDRYCFETSYELFHKYECSIMSVLKSLTSPSFHVFRMVSRVGPKMAYVIEKTNNDYTINNYLEEENQRLVPEINKTIEEKLRAYKMSTTLWAHDSKHSNNANVHHIVIGIEVVILLDIVHNMSLDKEPRDFMLDFIEMIVVDIRRIIFNVFGWHEYNKDWSLRGNVANCQCLVGSLINHSCVPNTNWEFNNGQIRFTTNKLIEKGEEITITYGPNKDIAYYQRQERLNHYFFACRCAICLEDVQNGHALKCTWCQGPVPFDGPLDQEPILKGQCLLCFTKYPDFEANVQEYRRCLNHLNEISNLVPGNDNLILLNKAKDLAKKLVYLSILPNKNVDKALMLFTNIMRLYDNIIRPEEKLEVIFLIDCFLQLEMESEDYEMLTNLFYCFNWLIKYIRSDQMFQMKSTISQTKTWNTLLHFKNRINKILQNFEMLENNQHVYSMIKYLKKNLNSEFENIKNEYEPYEIVEFSS